MATSFCQQRKEAEEKEKLLLESHPNRLPVAFWSLLVSGAGAHWSLVAHLRLLGRFHRQKNVTERRQKGFPLLIHQH
jgi:hypothetical protein